MDEGIDRLATRRGFDRTVYDPAEDSGLLATAVIDDVERASYVIDVGTGSGYVAARIRGEIGVPVLGIDVNPHACLRAKEAGVPTIRGDLLTGIAADSADLVVCNPPYLPTEPEEERDDWLDTALSGGPTGRAIIDRLIPDLDRVLVEGGQAYLLVSSLMDIDEVRETIRAHGFVASECDRDESFPFEVLVVLRLDRAGG